MERAIFGTIMLGVVGFVLVSVLAGCGNPEPQVIIVGNANGVTPAGASSMSFVRHPNGTIEYGSGSIPVVAIPESPERVRYGCTYGYDRVDDAGCRVVDDYRRCSACERPASDDQRSPVTVNVTQNNNGVPTAASTSTPRPVTAPRPTSTCIVPPPVSSAACR